MTNKDEKLQSPVNLLADVVGEGLSFNHSGEAMWLEVIHKMEEVYSDLLRYETDLEQKNTQLEEAQAFISSVIASISDIIVVCDAHGRILQVNPSFARIIGRAEPALIDTSITDYLIEADREQALALIISGALNIVHDIDLHFIAAGGEVDLMAMHCSARFDPHGRRSGAVLTGRPISELRRAYEALNQAHLELQRAQQKLVEQEKIASLGRLVAGVAHELNNPISFVFGNVHTLDRYRKNIVSYLQALHSGASKSDLADLRKSLKIDAIVSDLQPLIEGTLEGAARVSDIVKNLRRLSSTRIGERRLIELDKVVQAAVHLASRSKHSKAHISLDMETGLTIQAHEGQIHQVIVNLLDNAIDAVSGVADPKIVISAQAVDHAAEIVVSDNGVGIRDDVINKIFEPFFTSKEVGEGMGLGLWISHAIIQEHGGTIDVSNSAGRGSVFAIRLPLSGES